MEVSLHTEPHLLAGTIIPTVSKRNVTLAIDNGLNLVEWRQRKEQARGQVTVYGRRLRVSNAALLNVTHAYTYSKRQLLEDGWVWGNLRLPWKTISGDLMNKSNTQRKRSCISTTWTQQQRNHLESLQCSTLFKRKYNPQMGRGGVKYPCRFRSLLKSEIGIANLAITNTLIVQGNYWSSNSFPELVNPTS